MVTFPDFPECMTEGDNMEEAYKMAIDVLDFNLSTETNEIFPAVSNVKDIQEDGVIIMIPLNLDDY